MAGVNQQLHDEQVAHQVGLQRFSTWVVRRFIALLNRTDSDLMARLAAAVDQMPRSAFSVERLESLLQSVRMLNAAAYQSAGVELTTQLRGLVEHEAGFQQQLFQAVVPRQVLATVELASVQVQQVYAAAMAQPFQGRLLGEWTQHLESDRAVRIRDAVRIGFVEQQTVSEIVQSVRGTSERGYSDGIMEIDRRNAEAVVRTAISHTAGFTRDRFFKENDDLIKAVSWTSTLDSRTTPICQARDGKQYTLLTHRPIGHSLAWLGGPGRAHWRCRSTSVPITKSWKELGFDIKDTPPSTRASMDGEVPAEVTYGEWLARQRPQRQVEVLGASRAALFRSGGLKIDKFTDDAGKLLTLEQLKEQDRNAFDAAGLTLPTRPTQ